MAKIIYLDSWRKATNRHQSQKKHVSFTRAELNIILNIYSKKVGEGQWKDYAIDSQKNRAIFSIYNKAYQLPLFQIVKSGGLYSIIGVGGRLLKKSNRLESLLNMFHHKLRIVS